MFRKLYLLVVGSAVLAASMGFSATAFALIEPECAPYNNPVELIGFKIKTPDSSKAYEASKIRGGALACGSDIGFNKQGVGTLYREAYIGVANGVVITDPYAGGVQIGSYAGEAVVNVLTGITLLPARFDSNVHTPLSVVARGTGNCPGTEVVCYFGDGGLIGSSENWVEKDPVTSEYTMTIGEISGFLGTSGLTKINMTLCKNFGSVGGNSCGSNSGTVVQFNGDASSPGSAQSSIIGGGSGGGSAGCTNPNDNGIYTGDGIMRNGTTTPQVEACVVWLNHLTIVL